MSSILRIQFTEDFEKKYLLYRTRILGSVKKTINKTGEQNTPKSVLSIRLRNGTLSIRKDTGWVKLNDVEKDLNPEGQDFKVLFKLVTNKNHIATYKDLIGNTPTKTNKRLLSFVLRNLKEALGILPKKTAKNQEIIANIKGRGYKLLI